MTKYLLLSDHWLKGIQMSTAMALSFLLNNQSILRLCFYTSHYQPTISEVFKVVETGKVH